MQHYVFPLFFHPDGVAVQVSTCSLDWRHTFHSHSACSESPWIKNDSHKWGPDRKAYLQKRGCTILILFNQVSWVQATIGNRHNIPISRYFHSCLEVSCTVALNYNILKLSLDWNCLPYTLSLNKSRCALSLQKWQWHFLKLIWKVLYLECMRCSAGNMAALYIALQIAW